MTRRSATDYLPDNERVFSEDTYNWRDALGFWALLIAVGAITGWLLARVL